ncbi:hypothetical protein RclHR1_01990020 [Rhizophagus clarus]|uniref:BTB/POZ protein n=1 Tax=Rhizophagus clarus TaxID=94130 RepID=A0A2Z6RID4_9GLOM|nr:hypothetical protein RclHR1_01990020 [Rhizophagus clarus]GES72978.1 BTB/POZ protein [Rhizophagus clarus]
MGSNDERIILNVGGIKYETNRSTLIKYPETYLGIFFGENFKRQKKDNEYFFDRNGYAFRYVLEYYRTGQILWTPSNDSGYCNGVSLKEMILEFEFFKIPNELKDEDHDDKEYDLNEIRDLFKELSVTSFSSTTSNDSKKEPPINNLPSATPISDGRNFGTSGPQSHQPNTQYPQYSNNSLTYQHSNTPQQSNNSLTYPHSNILQTSNTSLTYPQSNILQTSNASLTYPHSNTPQHSNTSLTYPHPNTPQHSNVSQYSSNTSQYPQYNNPVSQNYSQNVYATNIKNNNIEMVRLRRWATIEENVQLLDSFVIALSDVIYEIHHNIRGQINIYFHSRLLKFDQNQGKANQHSSSIEFDLDIDRIKEIMKPFKACGFKLLEWYGNEIIKKLTRDFNDAIEIKISLSSNIIIVTITILIQFNTQYIFSKSSLIRR